MTDTTIRADGGLIGVASVVLYGLTIGVGPLMCSRSGGGLVKGVVLGLRIGVAFALAFGGYACYSHPTLRFVLRRSGALPLDTVRLFDYAAEQNLLRKVSRGYTFVHDLLQDNFAALEI